MQIEESWPHTIQAMRAAARESAVQGVEPAAESIHPAVLCRELSSLLPADASLVVDGGDIAGFAVLTMEALSPVSYTHLDVYKRQPGRRPDIPPRCKRRAGTGAVKLYKNRRR